MYDKLVAKVNSVETSEFVLKTKYDTHESDLEKRIPDTSGLVKILDYNANVTEMENKIASICGLVKKNSVKKQIITQKLLKSKKKQFADHDHYKYIATPEFDNLAERVFTGRLKQTNLVARTDFDDMTKKPQSKNYLEDNYLF